MKKTSYKCVIDRPLGSHHPKFDHIIYPINYGYIEGIMGGDGEEQDVYILGVDKPLETFEGELIAKIHRANDVEEKRVLAPKGMKFTQEQIKEQTYFQEQYFDSTIEMVKGIGKNTENHYNFHQAEKGLLSDKTIQKGVQGECR